MSDLPIISVIVPCRNEERFIGACLDSILASDYPKDRLEVLVVDGMSEDGTTAIVEQYARRYPLVRVLKNQKRITPTAFNIGIQHAQGDLIMFMGAHADLAKDAIKQCATYAKKYGADNVGGRCKVLPRQNNLIGKAIVRTFSHPFGVGPALYTTIGETETEPRWADTAAYSCYKREVFEKVGGFNEHLIHGQDMEFNQRWKRAGGKTLLVPSIVSHYYARSDGWSFCKYNLRNGLWALLPFAYSEVMPVCWRHLVPLAFVAGLVGSALLGLLAKSFLWLFAAIIGTYGLANLVASAQVARREHDLGYLLAMPFVFATLHLGYGLGSLWGVFRLAATPEFWEKLLAMRWWRSGPISNNAMGTQSPGPKGGSCV